MINHSIYQIKRMTTWFLYLTYMSVK